MQHGKPMQYIYVHIQILAASDHLTLKKVFNYEIDKK